VYAGLLLTSGRNATFVQICLEFLFLVVDFFSDKSDDERVDEKTNRQEVCGGGLEYDRAV